MTMMGHLPQEDQGWTRSSCYTLRSDPDLSKNKFPDPITDQIFEQNSDQIPIIDPIKITQSARKKTAFFANDNFLFLFVITCTI